MQRTRNGAERTMEWLPSFIRRSVGTKTERLTGKSGWCSGYHDRLTRDRSRVQSPHPILFISLIERVGGFCALGRGKKQVGLV